MRFTSSAMAAIMLLATTTTTTTKTNSVEAFAFTPSLTRSHCIGSDSALFLSPDDLTNAMAKAHEEKIRALKDIEDKKNAEIQVSGREKSKKYQMLIHRLI